MGSAHSSKYADGVDGRTIPKPDYVKELARREAQETRRRDWKANFLRAYASNGNITKSCRQADIDPRLFYKARKDDPEFLEAFEVAHRAATDKALEAVWEIGVEGVREPIIFQGEVVGYTKQRDWKAAKFILETFAPEQYSQRERIARMGMMKADELERRRDQMLEQHEARMKQFAASTPAEIPSTIDVEVVDEAEGADE